MILHYTPLNLLNNRISRALINNNFSTNHIYILFFVNYTISDFRLSDQISNDIIIVNA